jgi:hypothetical protein
MKALGGGLVFLLAASGLSRVAALSEPSCGVCHPDVRTEYAASIHARAIDCTGCHRGDSSRLDLEAHSAEAGFVGTPARQDVPALCADCHADPERMRAYGLPTDQYAQYLTSGHGRHLGKDPRVAVCTDCHGTHAILPSEEPTSPVAPQNIPATCGRCHSEQALMAEYDMPADQEEAFRGSVHGRALFADEHPRAPHCATCHGAHGAVGADVGTIATVCGHCHRRTREHFQSSPHRSAATEGRMSECVSCHGTHAIEHPTEELFDEGCRNCHAAESGAFATGQKLKTLISRAAESIQAADEAIADLQTTFPTVVRHRPRLQQARAHLMEARTVQHSFSVERTDDLTRTARSIGEEIRAALLAVEQGRRLRYLGLGAAWTFILFAVWVAILYRREKQWERDAASVSPNDRAPSTRP